MPVLSAGDPRWATVWHCRLVLWIELMDLFPTEVKCHAGHKADEYPTRFLGMDGWVDVAEVVDQWHQGTRDPEFSISDYFRVRGSDAKFCLLKHDCEADSWFIVTRD